MRFLQYEVRLCDYLGFLVNGLTTFYQYMNALSEAAAAALSLFSQSITQNKSIESVCRERIRGA